MTRVTSWFFLMAVPVAMAAQTPANFSGTWMFNPSRGQNLGQMAGMQDTATIAQTADSLTISERAQMQGQESTRDLHFDLTGKPVTNPGPMGDPNETIAKWAAGKLVVTWTAEGAVAGTKVVRTETRSLSADGKTMTVESVRGSNPTIVMVYDKR